MFQCTLEETDAITNENLEHITFVLAYPTVYSYVAWHVRINDRCVIIRNLEGDYRLVSKMRHKNLFGKVEENHEKTV
jgi:hypothetical protein